MLITIWIREVKLSGVKGIRPITKGRFTRYGRRPRQFPWVSRGYNPVVAAAVRRGVSVQQLLWPPGGDPAVPVVWGETLVSRSSRCHSGTCWQGELGAEEGGRSTSPLPRADWFLHPCGLYIYPSSTAALVSTAVAARVREWGCARCGDTRALGCPQYYFPAARDLNSGRGVPPQNDF